jgi:dynein heavy chain, axonemal
VQGNILDDEELINTLSKSKATSNQISAKVAEAEATERQIDEARELYRPVAARASLLFFCISDLALVDPMYQYSLTWFSSLFLRAMHDADTSTDVAARGRILNEFFTYSLYVNVCRSLFERHKLMLSLLLCIKILQAGKAIDPQEWRQLLAGPSRTDFTDVNPAPEWLTEKAWMEVLNVAQLPAFTGFSDSVAANIATYKVRRSAVQEQSQHDGHLGTPGSTMFRVTVQRPFGCCSSARLGVPEGSGSRVLMQR